MECGCCPSRRCEKNKRKREEEAVAPKISTMEASNEAPPAKRGKGRPKGSKNKPKTMPTQEAKVKTKAKGKARASEKVETIGGIKKVTSFKPRSTPPPVYRQESLASKISKSHNGPPEDKNTLKVPKTHTKKTPVSDFTRYIFSTQFQP
jgi:hypothetical protein